MHPEQAPITGREQVGDLSQPFQALVQFYHAFNSGDLELMSQNWEQSAEIAMDNPLGGIKRGWREIREVYRQIFAGPAQVYVEFYDYTIHAASDIFYAVGRERGFFKLGDKQIDLRIRTSRIFRHSNSIWRQVHHHGSIEAPDLLKSYQQAVLGK